MNDARLRNTKQLSFKKLSISIVGAMLLLPSLHAAGKIDWLGWGQENSSAGIYYIKDHILSLTAAGNRTATYKFVNGTFIINSESKTPNASSVSQFNGWGAYNYHGTFEAK